MYNILLARAVSCKRISYQLSGEAETARSLMLASWCITRYTIAMETWFLLSAGTVESCARVQPLTPLTGHESMHVVSALQLRCSQGGHLAIDDVHMSLRLHTSPYGHRPALR